MKQVAQYVIGYMSKVKVTAKIVNETVARIVDKLPKDAVWMQKHAKWLVHRIASAMVAGNTVSAQWAAWGILDMPVIDTNLRFTPVSLDDRLIELNLSIDPEDPYLSKRSLKTVTKKQAYAARNTLNRAQLVANAYLKAADAELQTKIAEDLKTCNMTKFVSRYSHSWESTTEGTKLWVFPKKTTYFRSFCLVKLGEMKGVYDDAAGNLSCHKVH